MKNFDKRWFPRYQLSVAVRFRCFEVVCKDVEIPTKTLNVSRSGLFMSSPLRLGLGSYMSLKLRLPPEVSGSFFSEFRCKGRVVHERNLQDGIYGYGVEIERAEPALRQTYLEELNSAWIRSREYSLPEITGKRIF
jgi:PilZ domain